MCGGRRWAGSTERRAGSASAEARPAYFKRGNRKREPKSSRQSLSTRFSKSSRRTWLGKRRWAAPTTASASTASTRASRAGSPWWLRSDAAAPTADIPEDFRVDGRGRRRASFSVSCAATCAATTNRGAAAAAPRIVGVSLGLPNVSRRYKTPENGEDRLKNHAEKCYAAEALEDFFKEKPREDDRRLSLETDFSFEQRLECDVLAMRWVRGSGRADNLLNDEDLAVWLKKASRDRYRPPSRKFAGASGELAKLDFARTVTAIDDDLEMGSKFYSGQPLMTVYDDMWSLKSKLPFLGMETSYNRPWAASPAERRIGVHLGMLHLPGRHGGRPLAPKTVQTLRKPGPQRRRGENLDRPLFFNFFNF